MMIEWLIYALAGSVSGLIAGLLGLGGGVVIVPVLVMVFRWLEMPAETLMHVAIGTSLMTITVTSLSSIMAHQRYQNIDWQIVRRMAPGLMLGSLFGAYVATMLTSVFLQWCFAVYVIVIAIRMWLPMPPSIDVRLLERTACCIFSPIAGMISALVGIGGGSLVVPYLVMANQTIKRAIGISSACGFPIALAGAVGFLLFDHSSAASVTSHNWQTGSVHWQAFLGLTMTSVIFAPVGARIAKHMPLLTLRRVFSLVLVAGGLYLLIE